jgi:cyclophilin family peptidyl-prolyl cis-trans isomerase
MKKITIVLFAFLLVGAGCAPQKKLDEEKAVFEDRAAASESASAEVKNNKNFYPLTTKKQNTMKTWPNPTVLPEEERLNTQAVIATDKGNIVFDILPDAPLAASNFISLARGGYYDGIIFHRVVPNFVIQGGDPTGTGTGGPGYKFADEPVSRAYDPGIVAMANAGPDTNGSQFFIMLPNSQGLPPQYTIFGKVTEGMDVVSRISVGDVMNKVTIEKKK